MKTEEKIKWIGETIAQQRMNKGIQLGELAEKAGVSRQTLGKIENGSANPTVDTLWKIADCLDISFAALMAEKSNVNIKKLSESLEVRSQDGNFSVTPLFTSEKAVAFDTYLGTLAPNTEYESKPHRPGVVELLTVIDGALEVIVGEDSYTLENHDSMQFNGDCRHIYRNTGEKPACIHFVVYYLSSNRGHGAIF